MDIMNTLEHRNICKANGVPFCGLGFCLDALARHVSLLATVLVKHPNPLAQRERERSAV